MKTLFSTILTICTIFSCVSCQPLRTVSVKVIGDDGLPIENAVVVVWFSGTQPNHSISEKGVTDKNGFFEASGRPRLSMICRVNKEGYYETESPTYGNHNDVDLTLRLREKKTPIPLHAKNVTLFFPENRKWLEYDLEKGDWLPPYGQGIYPDLRLKCDTEMTGDWEGHGTLEIVFEEGGGLILERENYLPNSKMKMPHQAPPEGYTSLFKRQEDSFRNKKREKNVGYFFRTRIVKNDDEIVQANYGKLLEDISFSPLFAHKLVKDEAHPESYATVSFSFYFNPTPNDRNLEFDPSQNLIEGLKYGERVNQP